MNILKSAIIVVCILVVGFGASFLINQYNTVQAQNTKIDEASTALKLALALNKPISQPETNTDPFNPNNSIKNIPTNCPCECGCNTGNKCDCGDSCKCKCGCSTNKTCNCDKSKSTGCDCGCEKTGKCTCVNCDVGNKHTKPHCTCGCVEGNGCNCHDCNHPQVKTQDDIYAESYNKSIKENKILIIIVGYNDMYPDKQDKYVYVHVDKYKDDPKGTIIVAKPENGEIYVLGITTDINKIDNIVNPPKIIYSPIPVNVPVNNIGLS